MNNLNKSIGKGLCLGIGGTNARVAFCENGDVNGLAMEKTPAESKKFFAWMADEIINAAEDGAKWVVIGVPGIVNEVGDKHSVGPLVNVPGLSDRSHVLEDELALARSEIRTLMQQGFTIKTVNDGLLAAYAAAGLYANHDSKRRSTVASFIIGTGVGGAIVRRVKDSDIFKPDEGLFEIGHLPLLDDHESTFETTISGPGIHKRHGIKPEEIDPDHQAWHEVGSYMGQLIMMMALIAGVEVVVACGGVGSNSYAHYKPHLDEYLTKFKNSSNAIHRLTVPVVVSVPPEDSQIFEARGAEGLMAYHLSTT